MQISSLMFREMKEYDDQMLRPYDGNASQTNLYALEDATEGGRDISLSTLAGIAGRIIRPSGEAVGRANIVNGWGEQRMMFAMTVTVRSSSRQEIIYEITGYTGDMGATKTLRGVAMDEKMQLFFNSITKIGRNYANTPRGNGWVTDVQRSNQVIVQQTNPDFTLARGRPGTLTMRPEDIFSRNTTNPTFRSRLEAAGASDMRGGFTSSPMKFSNRQNTSSTRWMQRSLTALNGANNDDMMNDPYGIERSPESVFKEARGRVREDAVSSDPVLEEISRDSNIMNDGFITYGELMQMNPDFDWDGVPVYFQEKTMRRSLRGEYRSWDGSDNETVAASMLVSSLPIYLINYQLAAVDFTATNCNTMGDMVVVATNASQIIEGPSIRDILPAFKSRLETEILKDILPWPDCPLDLHVDTSIASETYVRISLDNQPHEEFVFPVFCDSTVSPILTETQEYIDGMAATLSSIGDSLGHLNRQDNSGDEPRSRIITDPSRISFDTSSKKRSF